MANRNRWCVTVEKDGVVVSVYGVFRNVENAEKFERMVKRRVAKDGIDPENVRLRVIKPATVVGAVRDAGREDFYREAGQ